jgi:endonuclease/exonuclease/phosphatase family metal-dependent hydrolase
VTTVEHALPGASGVPGPRRALATRLDSPFGLWPVVSTHLDHRFDASATRMKQAHELLRLVAEVRGDPDTSPPLVLGGDLNALPESDEVRMLTGLGEAPLANLVMSDVWGQVGEGPGVTWSRANPYLVDSAWPNRRLDYLLVSWPRPKPFGNPVRAWLAGVEAVAGVQPSDHYAVVADLAIPVTSLR